MIKKQHLLNKLRVLLLASCHAPECKRISKCPRQCGCRTRRTFKLNTETSICWELADHIHDIVKRSDRPTKQEYRDLLIKARSYHDLSRFHMTKGWQAFFLNLYRCIEAIITPKAGIWDYWETEGTDRIEYLKQSLPRLKRYPRT